LIITFEQLADYRGRVAMVDGCFDPLHRGHLAYFAAAGRLGVPVLCNVAPDSYVSGKHPPFLPEEHRIELIDALRDIDLTHLNQGRTTAAVLRELQPRFYVKGSDWRGRLPAEETRLCDEFGIEIAYADVTPDASRSILAEFVGRQSPALELRTAEFECALDQAKNLPAGPGSEIPAELLETVQTLLTPTSIRCLGSAQDSASEVVVGYWGDRPLPLRELPAVARELAEAKRYACVFAGFHPSPEHLLSLVAGKPEPGDPPRPSRELVRVLLALEAFRSRRDLELQLEQATGRPVLLMERAS
jgi:cytidyltransferase-like protein